MQRFRDRRDAGRRLAAALAAGSEGPEPLVLALPRGGVPVAFEVARELGAPLDVFVVRKLGAPGREELALGAIAPGVRYLNEDLMRHLGVDGHELEAVVERERRELERRERLDRGDRPTPEVRGRHVVLVDDGLATGATMRAAVEAVRRLAPGRVTVAVPVGAPEACAALEAVADRVVCLLVPPDLRAVGLWYEDFGQTGDDEVRALLAAGGLGGA